MCTADSADRRSKERPHDSNDMGATYLMCLISYSFHSYKQNARHSEELRLTASARALMAAANSVILKAVSRDELRRNIHMCTRRRTMKAVQLPRELTVKENPSGRPLRCASVVPSGGNTSILA